MVNIFGRALCSCLHICNHIWAHLEPCLHILNRVSVHTCSLKYSVIKPNWSQINFSSKAVNFLIITLYVSLHHTVTSCVQYCDIMHTILWHHVYNTVIYIPCDLVLPADSCFWLKLAAALHALKVCCYGIVAHSLSTLPSIRIYISPVWLRVQYGPGD